MAKAQWEEEQLYNAKKAKEDEEERIRQLE
jgi:hypothetical protein